MKIALFFYKSFWGTFSSVNLCYNDGGGSETLKKLPMRDYPEELRKDKYGLFGTVEENACGVIAVHNILLPYETPPFAEMIKFFSRHMTAFFGRMGTRLFPLLRYLGKYGKTERVKKGKAYDAVLGVIVYLNRFFIPVGLHYFAGRAEEMGKYRFYNMCRGSEDLLLSPKEAREKLKTVRYVKKYRAVSPLFFGFTDDQTKFAKENEE